MHIHGFILLENAPDMDTLDRDNAIEMEKEKDYFNEYITIWNPQYVLHGITSISHYIL